MDCAGCVDFQCCLNITSIIHIDDRVSEWLRRHGFGSVKEFPSRSTTLKELMAPSRTWCVLRTGSGAKVWNGVKNELHSTVLSSRYLTHRSSRS